MTVNPITYNPISLAYVGDGIYEVFVRKHLVADLGIQKPNNLQRTATNYVSAKAQASLIEYLLNHEYLSEGEIQVYKRGRNAKSHTKAKNTSAITYNMSTGFEALFGYLYLNNQLDRVKELANICLQAIDNNEVQDGR